MFGLFFQGCDPTAAVMFAVPVGIVKRWIYGKPKYFHIMNWYYVTGSFYSCRFSRTEDRLCASNPELTGVSCPVSVEDRICRSFPIRSGNPASANGSFCPGADRSGTVYGKDGECRRMKRIRNDEFRIFNPCEEFQRPGVRNIPFRIGKRCEIVQGIQSGAELPGYLPCMFPNSGIIREIIYENIPFLGCYVRGNFLPALSVQQKNRIFHLFCRSADRKIPDYSYPCLLPHRYRIESLQFFVTKALYAGAISDTAKLAA